MLYEIHELTLGGMLDQSVKLMKNRFKMLFGIACMLYVPFVLIQELSACYLGPHIPDHPTQQQIAAFYQELSAYRPVELGLMAILFLIVMPLSNAAVIHGVANEYLGRPVNAGQCIRRGLRLMAPLVWTSLISGVIIALGLIALIIPGIFLALRYWLVSHVVVIEGLSRSAALKRSGALMKGNGGTALVLGLLLGIIGLAAQFASSFVPFKPLSMVVQAGLMGAMFIFGAGASVALYFSCRCKFEHFDLAVLAESVARDNAIPAGGEAAF